MRSVLNRLAVRRGIATFMVFPSVFGVAGLYRARGIRADFDQRNEAELKSLKQRLALTLVEPLWNLDLDLAKQIPAVELSKRAPVAWAVEDASSSVRFALDNALADAGQTSQARRIAIHREGEAIGNVVLQVGDGPMQAELRRQARDNLLKLGAVGLSIAVALRRLLSRLVTGPVSGRVAVLTTLSDPAASSARRDEADRRVRALPQRYERSESEIGQLARALGGCIERFAHAKATAEAAPCAERGLRCAGARLLRVGIDGRILLASKAMRRSLAQQLGAAAALGLEAEWLDGAVRNLDTSRVRLPAILRPRGRQALCANRCAALQRSLCRPVRPRQGCLRQPQPPGDDAARTGHRIGEPGRRHARGNGGPRGGHRARGGLAGGNRGQGRRAASGPIPHSRAPSRPLPPDLGRASQPSPRRALLERGQ